MKLVDLLTLCRAKNIEVKVQQGKLKVSAPSGALTDEIKGLLKQHKTDLLVFLSSSDTQDIEPLTQEQYIQGVPLSFTQKRLWFLAQLENSGLYNVGGNFAVSGELNLTALTQALNEIVRRHQVLRSVYQEQNGEPVQVLLSDFALEIEQFNIAAEDDIESAWLKISEAFAARPFDLTQDLMLRVGAVTVSQDEVRLMIYMHHIASDGWSLSVFVRELNRLYDALTENDMVESTSILSPLSVQYADYAQWQNTHFLQENGVVGKDFWLTYLQDLPEVHSLPLDAPRPEQQSHQGDVVKSHLPKALADKLNALGRKHGTTLFITLSSILSLLLSRYSGEDDIVLGTPIAGRVNHDVEPLIGCFVNTLVLRAQIDPAKPFSEFLQQYRNGVLSAYQYQHVPFEYLVEELNPSRHLQYNPLFQIMFALHNNERTSFSMSEVSFKPIRRESNTSKFDLSLDANEHSDGIDLIWRYATDIFHAETIERLNRYFIQLLQAVILDDEANASVCMEQLDMLPTPERNSIIAALNKGIDDDVKTSIATNTATNIADAFNASIDSNSHELALLNGDSSWTYQQLDTRINQCIKALHQQGIKTGDRVGVYLSSSADLIVTTMALFKMGAVYVPLDPEYPMQRLQYMVSDSGVRLIITHEDDAHKLAGLKSGLGVPLLSCQQIHKVEMDAFTLHDMGVHAPTAEDLAYIIYTSGSTGEPKGVMVTHSNVMHYYYSAQQHYKVTKADRVMQFASPSFDIYIEEVIVTLLSGATLVVKDLDLSPQNFWNWSQAQGITVASLPTAYWHLLCSELNHLQETLAIPLRLMITGGEKMGLDMLSLWQQHPALGHIQLLNTYGPTETTVIATVYDATHHDVKSGEIPIGRPVACSPCMIQNPQGQLVLPGAVGELVVTGDLVAKGYLNKPEQTRAVFGQCSDLTDLTNDLTNFLTKSTYRTGDLVRLNSRGDIEYVGRSDDQIKISGFRISIGEIERQIAKLEQVSTSLVLFDKDNTQAGRLVAVLVPELKNGFDHDALILQVHQQVKANLPFYMWPAGYQVLQQIPLTANGKVDKRAILQAEFTSVSGKGLTKLDTNIEQALAHIWAQRLSLSEDELGKESNFFEVGGHSLLAARIANDIRDEYGIALSVRAIFEHPVLSDLAGKIASEIVPDVAGSDSFCAQDREKNDEIPKLGLTKGRASFAQKRLWYIEQIVEQAGSYNIAVTRFFEKPLQTDIAEQAIHNIIQRHESLRTTFEVVDDELLQRVHDEFDFHLQIVPEDPARECMYQLSREGFDLSRDLLIRCALAAQNSGSVLLLCIHHIASDGWSINLFWDEFEQEYAALSGLIDDEADDKQATNIADLPIQYLDYSCWQNQRMESGEWQGAIKYWQQQLKDLPALHSIRTDFERPELQSFAGETYIWRLPDECYQALSQLAVSRHTSLFTLLHGALSIWLAKRGGETDIVIGAPVANRGMSQVERLIGFFANTIALRTQVNESESFSDYLGQLQQVNLDAQEYQDIPFDYLVELLNPERNTAYNPLIQILLTLEQEPNATLPTGEGRFLENRVAKFDLSLHGIETSEGLGLQINYCSDLFSRASIQAFAEQFTCLLEQITSHPASAIQDLNMVSKREQEHLLATGFLPKALAEDQDNKAIRGFVLLENEQLAPIGCDGEIYFAAASDNRSSGLRGYADSEGQIHLSTRSSELFWRKQLAQLPVRHSLPIKGATHDLANDTTEARDAVHCTVQADVLNSIEQTIDAHKLGLPVFLQAALSVLVSRYSDERDIVLAQSMSSGEKRILRHQVLAQSPVSEFLNQADVVNQKAAAHQDLTFADLVKLVDPMLDDSFEPLAQILLQCEALDKSKRESERQNEELSVSGNYDLVLCAYFGKGEREEADNQSLKLALNYRSALFSRNLITRMAEDLTRILAQLCEVKSLADISLSAGCISTPVVAAKELPVPVSDSACIHQLFEAQVARTPDSIALCFNGSTLSYTELNQQANVLAHRLIAQGVKPGDLVGVCVPRSLELVVALMAVLKSGAAYVPLDPDYPQERLAYIVDDARINIVLGEDSVRDRLGKRAGEIELNWLDVKSITDQALNDEHLTCNPVTQVQSTDLAYLIYTSGTTGKPKGVMIAHGNTVSMLQWALATYTQEQLSGVLAATSMCFDLSIFEMYAPLSCGGTCVVVKHILDVQSISNAQTTSQTISLINTVPSAIVQLLDANAVPESVRVVNLAGEALLGHIVEGLYQLPHIDAVYNLYGPSEDTTYSSYSLCSREAGRAPDIGIPLPGCEMYVVDSQGLIAPRGVSGELYIGGTGLSLGYLHKPELTDEKFIIFANQRFYRTGDIVRCSVFENDYENEQGVLEFIGRGDQQVKLNGFRIELGEIESVISDCEQVKRSAVLVREQANMQRLVAFVEYESEYEPQHEKAQEQVQEIVRSRLPSFMFPGEWITLEAMPLSANGKIERKVLRERYLSSSTVITHDYVQPDTEIEHWLVELWSRLLGYNSQDANVTQEKQIGVTDNFFALGGKSLLAIQVINAINARFDAHLAMVELFRYPTIRGLAQRVDEQTRLSEQGASADNMLLAFRLPSEQTEYPASAGQRSLWLVDRLHGGSHHYNVVFSRQVAASPDAIESALLQVLERHEPLRTVFESRKEDDNENELLYQRVIPLQDAGFQLEVIDCAEMDEQSRHQVTQQAMQRLAHHVFDLSCDVMLKACFIQRAKKEEQGQGLLLLNAHHIAVDGWSVPVFWQAFENALKRTSDTLPELPIRYLDFSAWQQAYLLGSDSQASKDYWIEHLGGLAPRHGLPMLESGLGSVSVEAQSYYWSLPRELSEQLPQLAQQHGVTLFMLMHAGLSVLVSRYSGERDVAIGTPSANRSMPELESLIGLFINTLVLRSDAGASQSVSEYLQHIREVNVQALSHQDIPFEMVVELLNPQRSDAFTPLFQIMLTMDNEGKPGAVANNHSREEVAGSKSGFRENTTEKFDLTLHVSPSTTQNIRCSLNFRTALFSRNLITRMAEDLTRILAQLCEVSTLADISLSAGCISTPVVAAKELPVPVSDSSCIHQLFEAQVARTPEAIALRFNNTTLSYLELNQRANVLAHRLIAQGVKPGDLVGVCVPRSLELVVALMAVLKSGAAYVPLDPDYPQERLAYIVDDARINIVLGEDSVRDRLGKRAGEIELNWLDVKSITDQELNDEHLTCNPVTQVQSTDLAYLIYTSGTTGKPKGVMIAHGNTVSMLQWALATYTQEQLSGVLAATSMCFDLSIFEMYAPLSCGGTCVVVKHILDVQSISNAQTSSQTISLINTVPSAIVQLLDANAVPESVRVVNLAGEALLGHIVEGLYQLPHIDAVYNLYGPSEDTTYSSYSLCSREVGRAPDIGIPLPGCEMYVVDSQGLIAPRGVSGELYIGGTGLSLGYLHKPELTDEKFIIFANQRFYRTGDIVRLSDSEDGAEGEYKQGVLEFIGRGDQQVKLNGFRIELGEIESVISDCEQVKRSAVLVREQANMQRLVAFIEYESEYESEYLESELEVQEQVRSRLPSFMFPGEWITLEAMPLSANGKIERKVLRERYLSSSTVITHDYVHPDTEIEHWLVELWSRLLGYEQADQKIGVTDNFFALGGKSLLAIQVINAINARFDVHLAMVELFRYPTIRGLAQRVDEQGASAGNMLLAFRLPGEQTEYPASAAQHRMWLIEQLSDGAGHYTIPFSIATESSFDLALAEHALRMVIERHEPLRTVFENRDEVLYQQVMSMDAVDIGLEQIDCSTMTEDKRHQTVRSVAKELAEHQFDLSKDVMLTALHVKLSEQQGLLLINVHHIAFDGWSQTVFIDDFNAIIQSLTDNSQAELPPLPIRYLDYSAWQQHYLESSSSQADKDYWQNQLQDMPTLQGLEADFERPELQCFEGKSISWRLAPELQEQLKALAAQHHVSLFMLLHGAFSVLLSRRSQRNDIVIGAPVANRTRTELTHLVGFFVNTLVLRTQVDPATEFASFLEQIKQINHDAQLHQDMPFDYLVEMINPPRSTAYNPLVQVAMTLDSQEQNVSWQLEPKLAGDHVAKFDIELHGIEAKNGLGLQLIYSTGVYHHNNMLALANQLTTLLQSIVAAPKAMISQLNLVSDNEREQILAYGRAHGGYLHQTELSMAGLFEKQVAAKPNAMAVACGDKFISYEELDRLSTQLMKELQLQQGEVVAVALPRSIELVVAFVAVFKAQAIYLPIDVKAPQSRVDYMLEDAGASRLLSSSSHAFSINGEKVLLASNELAIDGLELVVAQLNLEPRQYPSALAYILYTSGSTGTPKGVMVSPESLINTAYQARVFDMDVMSNMMNTFNPAFDPSVYDLASGLLNGKGLVMLEQEHVVDFQYWRKLIEDYEINSIFLTTALFHFAVKHDINAFASFDLVAMGGEAAIPELVQAFVSHFPNKSLVNVYGPTETTIMATFLRMTADNAHQAPIGRPLAGYSLYILDSEKQPVALGCEGELYIAGAGVAQGYVNLPEKTAESFITDPFTNDGSVMYRTGDMVRFNHEGMVLYRGRQDDQVKIRGHRIELGDIEAHMREIDGVRDAVIIVSQASDEPQLHGFIELESSERYSSDRCSSENSQNLVNQVHQHLVQSLPEYMCPSQYAVLDAFPLTSNGKLDKRALPEADLVPETEVGEALQTENEKQLAALWAGLLGVDADVLSRQSHFFALGGHSLLIVRLKALLLQKYGINLVISELFNSPVLMDMALRLEDKPLENGQRESKKIEPQAIVPLPADTMRYPASPSQSRMWLIDQLSEGQGRYNVPFVMPTMAGFDLATAKRALQLVIERHEPLRTVYKRDGETLYQVVQPMSEVAFDIEVVKCCNSNELKAGGLKAYRTQVRDVLRTEEKHHFDMSQALMLRAVYVDFGQSDFTLDSAPQGINGQLIVNIHHIAFDGWSESVFLRDYQLAYQALAAREGEIERANVRPDWTVLPIRYLDYTAWLNNYLQGEASAQSKAYWQSQLQDLPLIHQLEPDFVRPEVQSFSGETYQWQLPSELLQQLKTVAAEHGLSLYMLLHAAFAIVLARRTDSEDIVLGAPVANRNLVETSDLIGFFVNTLVLRASVQGESSVADYLSHIRELHLAAQQHQDIPFDYLVELLNPARSTAYNPLVQMVLTLERDENASVNLAFDPRFINDQVAKFDLALNAIELGSKEEATLLLNLNFCSALFHPDTITSLAEQLTTLFEQLAQQSNAQTSLHALNLVSDREREQLLALSTKGRGYAHQTQLSIAELFALQVQSQPELLAVACESQAMSQTLTFRELDTASDALIAELSIQPSEVIAVALPRSVELLVAFMAVCKAGAIYVPIDTSAPQSRVEFILQDAGASKLIHQTGESAFGYMSQELTLTLTQGLSVVEFDAQGRTQNEDVAYIIYTSGSTGTPKGVMVSPQAAINTCYQARLFDMDKVDAMMCTFNPAFDPCVFDMLTSMLNGKSLIMVPQAHVVDFQYWQHLHEVYGVNLAGFTTALFNFAVKQDIDALAIFEQVFIGGEAAVPELVQRYKSHFPNNALFNMYGPTETAIIASFAELTMQNAHLVPIGQAIGGARLYVLDKQQQPVPRGCAGELYIGGEGVAIGYVNLPQRTEQSFVPDPFVQGVTVVEGVSSSSKNSSLNNPRMYRSGDLVRFNHNGELLYLGRQDDQVKLRGHRIELGDIEQHIRELDIVRDAVVLMVGDDAENRRLDAYIELQQADSNEQETVNHIHQHLNQQLPAYMLPAQYALMQQFPMTSNGKLDKRALPEANLLPESEQYVAPETEIEILLVDIWADLLGIQYQAISRNSHFFELGGHSLLMVRLKAAVQDKLACTIPVTMLFNAPILSEMASAIQSRVSSEHFVGETGTHSEVLEVLQQSSTSAPEQTLFMVHPVGGDLLCYQPLLSLLSAREPNWQVYGLHCFEPHQMSLTELAEQYVMQLKIAQPQGPYHLVGYSLGGIIAYEMARQLNDNAELVASVSLIDSTLFANAEPGVDSDMEVLAVMMVEMGIKETELWKAIHHIYQSDSEDKITQSLALLLQSGQQQGSLPASLSLDELQQRFLIYRSNRDAFSAYQAAPYDSKVNLLIAKDSPISLEERGWQEFTQVNTETADGDHFSILNAPNVERVSQWLREIVEQGEIVREAISKELASKQREQ
ncbi:amino acid adenylation domain-containing protein [Paraneptunicella aestuarii]|uniref:non-ribosomal peptide synthetase n=1 Tax=Paraneptunicella aestuarii TaxID=2831148 RepID=UPI001E5BDE89|nr:non-ribosomal peptide synthetase [Paraneptunicella aestuarii]UAA37421.1 amino acid adenylation domain-containing protein [Paraneptunicella aestuarii]